MLGPAYNKASARNIFVSQTLIQHVGVKIPGSRDSATSLGTTGMRLCNVASNFYFVSSQRVRADAGAARPFGRLGEGASVWLCQPYVDPETLSANRMVVVSSTTGISILSSVLGYACGTLQLRRIYAHCGESPM